jgi:pyruvate dehydrogenase E2 component (dihydrolipoamide acetyltransferase)
MPIPAPPQVAPGKSRRVGLSNLRKTIGRRMQASHQSTAAVTLTRKVDATELKLLRDRILKDLAEGDVHPTYTDFLVKIVGRCLGHHPQLNAHFSDGEALELYDEVHMGLAVDTERGLLVPVIRDAGHKGLLELAADRASLVRRTLEGSITPDELSGGTFTITNLGPLGVDAFTPIINPPQVAILGVGRIHPEPAAYEGQIALREMMFLSLTFDHRAVDGAPAARLLQDIAQLIEKPHLMWL